MRHFDRVVSWYNQGVILFVVHSNDEINMISLLLCQSWVQRSCHPTIEGKINPHRSDVGGLLRKVVLLKAVLYCRPFPCLPT